MDQSIIPQLTVEFDGLPDAKSPAEHAEPERCSIREGSLCPNCGRQKLAYDGLLNLTCPDCGLVVGGSFT